MFIITDCDIFVLYCITLLCCSSTKLIHDLRPTSPIAEADAPYCRGDGLNRPRRGLTASSRNSSLVDTVCPYYSGVPAYWLHIEAKRQANQLLSLTKNPTSLLPDVFFWPSYWLFWQFCKTLRPIWVELSGNSVVFVEKQVGWRTLPTGGSCTRSAASEDVSRKLCQRCQCVCEQR